MREVCGDCAQKCLSVHGKKKISSNVPSSFFKVMIGSDFSSVLYLPPKFGPTASALVHKEAIIEDSSGQQWKVIVSIVNKSFALREGWNAFSLEHGLEVGNFLVFNYIGESHFVVKIFDKSGCEKFDFSKQRKQKKRSRSKTDLGARDDMLSRHGSSLESDVEKMQSQHEVVDIDGARNNEGKTPENKNTNGRVQSLYKDKNCEDPYYMTDRDFAEKEREDRSPMFDVFSYEILNNSGVDGTGKFTTRNETVGGTIYSKDPLLEEMLYRGATQDPFEVELTGRSHFLEEIDKGTFSWNRHSCGAENPEHLLITYTMRLEKNNGNSFIMSNWEDQKCQFTENSETNQVVISKELYPLHIGNCQNSEQMIIGIHGSPDAPIYDGEMERIVQKELLDMTPDVCSYNDQFLSTRFSEVILGDRAQSSQTIIKDHGRNLNSVKAEPFDYGASHMLASISQTKSNDGANGGAPSGPTKETLGGPLP